jgi:hypothetical protein
MLAARMANWRWAELVIRWEQPMRLTSEGISSQSGELAEAAFELKEEVRELL